jgi:hypothetical protein
MPKPNLVQIGNRILNINAIRYIEIEGPQIVNVHLFEEERPLQFIDAEGDALMAALNTGYVYRVNPVGIANERAFEDLMKELDRPQ